MHHRVLIDIQGEHKRGFKSFAERMGRAVLDIVAPAEPCELSILLTDDSTIKELNRTHRSIDSPTDVLAFSLREGEAMAGLPAKKAFTMVGDVVISLETAQRQAEEQGEPIRREVALLITHGILHLFGYDDGTPDEYDRMMKRSREILEALGSPWESPGKPQKKG